MNLIRRVKPGLVPLTANLRDGNPLTTYDTILIGGGHNGLVCAAYLARKGQRVVVLEAADQLGGLAATREFHPGFNVSVAHSVSHFSAKVARDLDLANHGCTFGGPMTSIGLSETGDHVSVCGNSAQGVSAADKKAFVDYRTMMAKFAGVMNPVWMKTMPRFAFGSFSDLMTFGQIGLKLRLLGKEDMGEFMRVATLPARDLMDENFESDLLKSLLSWDGLIGSKMAPRSPNSTVLSMLLRMSGEAKGDHVVPIGGMSALIGALAKSAEAAGADIRTGAPVEKILIEGDESGLTAHGVQLEGGEQILARCVVSSADPKRTFIDLVGAQNLEIEFTNRIDRLRSEGFVAKLHLALKDVPTFKGIDKPDGRMIIAPKLDSIEFAYDDAKYGEASKEPVMEVFLPSLHDPSLASDGQVMSVHVMYVPYTRKGGWTAEARQALSDKVISTIAKYAPDLREKIVHQELLTPKDLEDQHMVTGGHWHHTELAMDQMFMMRPTYEAAQYGTPIPGLYLCGAGTHPGGGLMGAAGHNSAREILR